MGVLKTAFSTWIIALPLTILLLAPALWAITFLLRCLFWLLNAFVAVTTSGPLPDFWG